MTQQQTQQIQPLPPSDAARLFAVEKDVLGLKDGLAALTNSVDKGFRELAADMRGRATINWQPIAILLGVLGSLGTMGFTWINTGQSRLETMIAKQELRSERYVPREDLDARFTVIAQRRDDLQRLSDARIERIERDVDALAKQVVPRGEHDTIRQLQTRDYDLLRDRLARIEGRFEKRADSLGHQIERLGETTMPRTELQGRLDGRDRPAEGLRR